MEEINAEIKKLHENLLALLKKYKHLEKENEQLKNSNATLHGLLTQKENALKVTEEKYTVQYLAALHNTDEKKVVQQKIDYYLKDIERCLSLLNA